MKEKKQIDFNDLDSLPIEFRYFNGINYDLRFLAKDYAGKWVVLNQEQDKVIESFDYDKDILPSTQGILHFVPPFKPKKL